MQLVIAGEQQFQAPRNVGNARTVNQRLVGETNAVIADRVPQLRTLAAHLDS
jgi:hypothetical protein